MSSDLHMEGDMEISDVKKYRESLESCILSEIKKFEENTGIEVTQVGLSRRSVLGYSNSLIVGVDVDLRI